MKYSFFSFSIFGHLFFKKQYPLHEFMFLRNIKLKIATLNIFIPVQIKYL